MVRYGCLYPRLVTTMHQGAVSGLRVAISWIRERSRMVQQPGKSGSAGERLTAGDSKFGTDCQSGCQFVPV